MFGRHFWDMLSYDLFKWWFSKNYRAGQRLGTPMPKDRGAPSTAADRLRSRKSRKARKDPFAAIVFQQRRRR